MSQIPPVARLAVSSGHAAVQLRAERTARGRAAGTRLLDDSSITPALTMRAPALCIRMADLHVDPHVRSSKNHHCPRQHAEKNEKPQDRNEPMEHRILQRRDEDGHPMAAI